MNISNTFILTDVLPGELPLIYSNSSLFKLIANNEIWHEIDCTYESVSIGVEPFNYTIRKRDSSKRVISLVHPISQLAYTKFIETFEDELLHYFDLNETFSCRYPTAVPRKEIKNILKKHKGNSNDVEELKKELPGYFKYRFPRLSHFYKSRALLELEIQFSNLKKIDIQNCFGSIYTHSLEWAYLGSKSLAKECRLTRKLTV